MKKALFLLVFCSALLHGQAQKLYHASEINTCFSAGMVKRNNTALKTPVRFAPFLNISHQYHLDFGRLAGVYTGIELKNVGLVIKDTFLTKHRAYSAGLMLGLKLGRMDKNLYFFAGGTYEYLFGYKEKILLNHEKIRRTDFYLHDVNQFIPALFAGVNLHGITFRVQYYLTEFFSPDYHFVNRDGYVYPTFSSSRILLFMAGYKRNIRDGYKKKQSRKTKYMNV